jgi:hypothetical protein
MPALPVQHSWKLGFDYFMAFLGPSIPLVSQLLHPQGRAAGILLQHTMAMDTFQRLPFQNFF